VTAPTDGYVTQLFLRSGMVAVPMPLRPVMVFHPQRRQHLCGGVPAECPAARPRSDEAEVAFDAIPGRVFKGEVEVVLDAGVEGQVQPTGTLIDPESRQEPGRALARIKVTEDLSTYQLPAGSAGQVAVYTEHWHHFAIIRRILLRMKSWMNYVFSEGH
jgi:multidrug resistance efflux pump